MKSVPTISVSQFKARALSLLEEIAHSKRELVITKRGKPIARVLPFDAGPDHAIAGRLAHTVARDGDIVSPLGADAWESAR